MRPITEILVEFPRASRGFRPAGLLPRPTESPPEHGRDAAPDRERLLAEARQAGWDEGSRQAEHSCEERLSALAATQEAALVAARAAWAAGEGAALAEQLRAALAALEGTIAAGVAAVMAPLLTQAVRTRAADEIRAALTEMVAGGQGALIAVDGPADLVEPIRAAFVDHPAVVVTDSEGPEVSVRAGDAAVATQIEAWAGRLQAALEVRS